MQILSGESGVRPDDNVQSFMARHGQVLGEPFQRRIPYYLLIAAPPSEISFRFQQELSLVHAIGRMPFTNLEEIHRFGQQIVDRERTRPKLSDEAALFYALHSGDLPDGASTWVRELQGQVDSNRGICGSP